MSKQSDFIETISSYILSTARARGYKIVSPVIGQAILESGFGETQLSKYNNFFGMKSGRTWTGQTVTMTTTEQTASGSLIKVNAVFRAYPSMAAGVEGYFDFISAPRYKGLKTATSPRDYLDKIKAAGYATDHQYVNKVLKIISTYNLTRFDDTTESHESEALPSDLEWAADTFANYVIAGFLGNGEERKELIYNIIQGRVNERIKQ